MAKTQRFQLGDLLTVTTIKYLSPDVANLYRLLKHITGHSVFTHELAEACKLGRYLIENFLAPWGYIVNGEVKWQGEEGADVGLIVVTNNVVVKKKGTVVYEETE